MRILIVDDHDVIRTLLGMNLSRFNHSISYAVSADEAVQKLPHIMPDLVLLDVMMGGEMTGIDLCRLIKSSPSFSYMKVFILTAKSEKEDFQEGLAAGADRYFTKPFSPVEISQAVQNVAQSLLN
jgi:two-component system, OmpR family, phosphate regulon response regulator PhoB